MYLLKLGLLRPRTQVFSSSIPRRGYEISRINFLEKKPRDIKISTPLKKSRVSNTSRFFFEEIDPRDFSSSPWYTRGFLYSEKISRGLKILVKKSRGYKSEIEESRGKQFHLK